MNKKKLTITICTNKPNNFNSLLKHLSLIKDLENVFEIIVIDSSSKNSISSTISKSKKIKKILKITKVHPNSNLSEMRNLAIKTCHTNLLLFLDDDIYFSKNLVEKYLKSAKLNKHAAAIGGPIIPTVVRSILKPPWFTKEIIQGPAFAYLNFNKKLKVLKYPLSLHTGNCLLNLEVLGKDAYFDSSFGQSPKRNFQGEDVELIWRLQKRGYKVIFDKSLQVKHIITKGKLTKKFVLKKYKYWGKTEALLHYMFLRRQALLKIVRYKIMVGIKSLIKSIVLMTKRDKNSFFYFSESYGHLIYIVSILKILLFN